MKEWLPIETAPKDGTHILVAVAGSETPGMAFWSPRFNRWIDTAYEDLDCAVDVCGADWVCGGDWPITHWQPAPVPPPPPTKGEQA